MKKTKKKLIKRCENTPCLNTFTPKSEWDDLCLSCSRKAPGSLPDNFMRTFNMGSREEIIKRKGGK